MEAGDESEVTCLRLSPDESRIVVAYRNLLMRQFSVSTATLIKTWKSGHRGPILKIVYDTLEDGGALATGSADYSVRVWDTKKEYCTHNLKGSAGIVTSVLFCRNVHGRRLLYVGSQEGQIALWDLDLSQCLAKFRSDLGNAVVALIWNRDRLISADRGRTITVWIQLKSFRNYTSMVGFFNCVWNCQNCASSRFVGL